MEINYADAKKYIPEVTLPLDVVLTLQAFLEDTSVFRAHKAITDACDAQFLAAKAAENEPFGGTD